MNFQNMYSGSYPITSHTISNYMNDVQSNTVVNVSTVVDNTIKKKDMHNIIKNVAHETIYRNRGWFNKTKNIVNYLHKTGARCLQCYDMIEYKDIVYSRILNNNDNKANSDNNNNYNQNIIGNITCL